MNEALLRKHYAATALARMGVTFERGMQIEAVRIVVEAAARADVGNGSGGEMKKAA